MATERVSVNFDANTSGLQTGVTRAKGMLGGLGSYASGIGGKLAGVFSAAIFTRFGASAIKAAADMQSLKSALASVSKGESVDSIMALSEELAKLPALGLEDVVRGFVQLKAAGMGTNDAARTIREIGNAVASGGGGVEQFGQAIFAIQQIMGSGKVLGQDLNQLKNAIPGIGAVLKQAFGATSSEGISEADKEAKKFLDTIIGILEQGPRVEANLKTTIENTGLAWQKAKAALGEYLALLASPAMEKATSVLEANAKFLEQQSKGQTKELPSVADLGLTEKARAAQVSSTLALLYSTQAKQRMQAEGKALFSEEQLARNKAEKSKEFGKEFGPGNAEGIAQFRQIEAARSYYQFLESKRAIGSGIASVDEQLKGLSPTNPIVAGSLTRIGGGGNVFGGGENKQYAELVKHRTFLVDQLKTLGEIEANTQKGILMP